MQFQELCYLPAYTVMVFMRSRIGLRLLSPLQMLRAAMLLYLYSQLGVFWLHGSLFDVRLVEGFGAAFILLAVVHYIRSWRALNRGDKWHSLSSGISHIGSKLCLPGFLLRNRHVYRTIDPLIVVLVGFCLLKLSMPFALWLFLSAFSLQSFEQARYLAALTRDIDIADSLTEAEIQQQTVEHFSRGTTKSRRLSPTANAVPSGIGLDITSRIAERKAGESTNDSPQTLDSA